MRSGRVRPGIPDEGKDASRGGPGGRAGEPGAAFGFAGAAGAANTLSVAVAPDEAETIRAVLAGDVDRFGELVDRYQGQALRVAFSLLGNHEDAEDVAQEAFVNAFRSLASFRHGAKFSTWLYRIVVNQCKDRLRRRTRGEGAGSAGAGSAAGDVEPGLFAEAPDPNADAGRHVRARELADTINRAIGGLSANQRTAFLMHYVHELPLKEVAEVMGCRVGTVKSHLFRATRGLQRQLRPWIIEGEG